MSQQTRLCCPPEDGTLGILSHPSTSWEDSFAVKECGGQPTRKGGGLHAVAVLGERPRSRRPDGPVTSSPVASADETSHLTPGDASEEGGTERLKLGQEVGREEPAGCCGTCGPPHVCHAHQHIGSTLTQQSSEYGPVSLDVTLSRRRDANLTSKLFV